MLSVITESLLRNDSCYLVQAQQTLLWFYLPCSDTSTFSLRITITIFHIFIGLMQSGYLALQVEGQVVKSRSIKLSLQSMQWGFPQKFLSPKKIETNSGQSAAKWEVNAYQNLKQI